NLDVSILSIGVNFEKSESLGAMAPIKFTVEPCGVGFAVVILFFLQLKVKMDSTQTPMHSILFK
ncbi:MAG TPA: hypothetical protein VKR58_08495, partial [Aquella sp.]|nr:hypothetical protein [Aquella sp.]